MTQSEKKSKNNFCSLHIFKRLLIIIGLLCILGLLIYFKPTFIIVDQKRILQRNFDGKLGGTIEHLKLQLKNLK